MSHTDPMPEREETPESMQENPFGGCRAYAILLVLTMLGVCGGIILAILKARGAF